MSQDLSNADKAKRYQQAQNYVDRAKYILKFIDPARADTLQDMVDTIQGDINEAMDEEYYSRQPSVYGANGA
jgi:hypothetical protein